MPIFCRRPCRYQDHQTAANLIGYVNQGDSSGAAGLELMCDRQLSKSCHRLAMQLLM